MDKEENITVGDLNCPLNTILDKKTSMLMPRKSVISILNSIQGDLDLINTSRVKIPIQKAIRVVKTAQRYFEQFNRDHYTMCCENSREMQSDVCRVFLLL